METITFTPAQVQVFNLVSHIKTAAGLEKLRQQLAAFYAKQIDEEMMHYGKADSLTRSDCRNCAAHTSVHLTRSKRP